MASAEIELAGTRVQLSDLRASPARYLHTLEQTRASVGHARCMCRGEDPLRLVIRARAGRFHLARWPYTGHQHVADCPFYAANPAFSGRAGCLGAISEDDDGIAVRLDEPLLVRPEDRPPSRIGAAGEPSSAVRGTIGLLSLLHLLWELGALNTLRPDQVRARTWSYCRERLSEQAEACEVNRRHLSEVLYLPLPFRSSEPPGDGLTRFTEQLGRRRDGAMRRGLILGEIRQIEPTPFGMRLRFVGLPRPVFVAGALFETLTRSYRSAFAAAAPGARRIMLALIERSPRDYLTVVDAAVMLTNRAYVPADSSYEVRMADALLTAGRHVLKPLRYQGQAIFPDFVLIDQDPATYVEVYGIIGREDYEDRKRDKQRYYQRESIPVIEWTVTGPMPELRSPEGSANAGQRDRSAPIGSFQAGSTPDQQ